MASTPNAPLDLRPMSVGELLDRTFSVYRDSFLLWIGIVVVPQLFYFATTLIARTLQTTQRMEAIVASLAVIGVGWLIYWIAMTVSQAAVVGAVSERYLGGAPTVASAYAVVRPRVWPVVALGIISGLAVIVGTMMCLLPGLAMAIFFALSMPALVVEKTDIGGAIERSFSLGKDAWPKLLLVYLLYGVLLIAAGGVGGVLGIAAVAYQSHMLLWIFLQSLIGFVLNTLVIPWVQIAVTLVYFDQRIRREGFDLQLLIAGLDAPPPPAPAPPAAL